VIAVKPGSKFRLCDSVLPVGAKVTEKVKLFSICRPFEENLTPILEVRALYVPSFPTCAAVLSKYIIVRLAGLYRSACIFPFHFAPFLSILRSKVPPKPQA
jgi:hypothetical protein